MKAHLVHNIGYHPHNTNYTSPELLAAIPSEDLLTFDGVYQNVVTNAERWADKKWNRKPIFFVMGMYVGRTNLFDKPNFSTNQWMCERYCDWNDIMKLLSSDSIEVGCS